jgi:hypothetical protein
VTVDGSDEPLTERLTTAPGNGAPLGGLKIVTASGWLATRLSGTVESTSSMPSRSAAGWSAMESTRACRAHLQVPESSRMRN